MKKNTWVAVALAASSVWGCAGTMVSRVAHVRPSKRYRYEIEIRANEAVYGGPCRPPSFIPTYVDTSHWIYTNVLEGTIPAEQIVLTYERGKTDYPWPQSALRGSITISGDAMRIELETPYYRQDSTIKRHDPYRFNGNFTLERQAP